MATKTVVKKKKDPQPTNGAGNVNSNDARVAQQMRVLEVVGAGRKDEKDDKKYSPRTENHIKQLTDLLDCFQYSRADIASLVRRCHYDETQIQVAVANIIEDKANHGMEAWGEVKSKKQLKEEKKIREEEEKREQEIMEKELERQRLEAEKRAKKDAERQRGQRGGNRNDSRSENNNSNWGGGDDSRHDSSWQEDNWTPGGGAAALPPDPAILFAGSKPATSQEEPEKGNSDWWDGNNSWDWDEKDKGSKAKSSKDQDWEDWKWKGHSWDQNDWGDGEENSGGNGKADDEWWSNQEEWKTQEKRGKKAPKERAASSKVKQEKLPPPEKEPKVEDSADMWDMPDANASQEGGLDQWTLGDIRAADADAKGRRASDRDAEAPPPESAMRTVEEIERQQLGAAAAGNAAAPGGKSRIEMLLGDSGAEAAGLPPPPANAASERNERGRGRGRGGDRKEGRGRGGDREKADRGGGGGGDKGKPPPEPEGEKERLERLDRSDDPRRQPMEEVGENVTVRKHSSMGCAVVSMKDTRVREAILRLGHEIVISGIKVQMKPHTDKETKMEIPTDIFVAWGRQVEKTSPLSERELTKYFDARHQELLAAWNGEAEEKQRRAEEAARQQKLLEEQQRQQADLQAREEQRRAYEAELSRRQQEEADSQRKAEEQRRLEEQRRMQQDQAIWAAGARAAAAGADPRAAGLGTATVLHSVGQPAQPGHAQDPASHASAAGLTVAAAYAQNPQAAAQWSAAQHWMQTMAYHTQQQGWQQQLAQRAGMQQMPNPAMAQMGATTQDYDALRHQAAYYAYLAEQQRQGQTAAQAAYAQQTGYQQAGAQFGYGAAYGGRSGERI